MKATKKKLNRVLLNEKRWWRLLFLIFSINSGEISQLTEEDAAKFCLKELEAPLDKFRLHDLNEKLQKDFGSSFKSDLGAALYFEMLSFSYYWSHDGQYIEDEHVLDGRQSIIRRLQWLLPKERPER
ncbi:hypothetical protein A3F66_01000 [candidate division TM6 bacterium RIFCSPHIGHO2_12_FULL_32_22]|nr:MAG: hypothetical protein A3F66_01000 [candidate division TM6 bacterium RIFCSPHIGHO2_12_FULL_32_22]